MKGLGWVLVDLTEWFVHWEAGRSQVLIGESLGLDRPTRFL